MGETQWDGHSSLTNVPVVGYHGYMNPLKGGSLSVATEEMD